jgi:hypothetical protein
MHGVVNADLSAASTVVLSPRVLPPYDPVTDLYGPPSLHWCHPPSQRVYPYPRGTDDSVCFGGGIKFDATSDEASDDDAASAASPTAPFALMACVPESDPAPEAPDPGIHPKARSPRSTPRIFVDADGDRYLVDGSGPDATYICLDHPLTPTLRLKGSRGHKK